MKTKDAIAHLDVPETEALSIRGIPIWAATAIRRRANRSGLTYAAQVRVILTDAALRYDTEDDKATASEVATA